MARPYPQNKRKRYTKDEGDQSHIMDCGALYYKDAWARLCIASHHRIYTIGKIQAL